MKSISELSLNQRREDLFEHQCIHSKTVEYFIEDYSNIWDIPLPTDISILFTVTTKQKNPICSLCKTSKCKCFFKYKKSFNYAAELRGEDRPEYHWERRSNLQNLHQDFHEPYPLDEHYKYFGYNRTPIMYPLWRDPTLQSSFVERLQKRNKYELSANLVAKFDQHLACSVHGQNLFKRLMILLFILKLRILF